MKKAQDKGVGDNNGGRCEQNNEIWKYRTEQLSEAFIALKVFYFAEEVVKDQLKYYFKTNKENCHTVMSTVFYQKKISYLK